MRFLTFILAFVFLLGIAENAKAENESSGNVSWHDIVSASSSQNKAEKKRKFQKAVMLANDMSSGQDITFEQVMKDPDNIKLNMAYAKTQIRKGDIKGASATLERMLRINPRLEEVRLLYAAVLYRLDNMTETKEELSKIDKRALPEKSRIEYDILKKMIEQREKKTTWSGQLSAGINYDTNRNAFPEDDTIIYPNGSILKLQGEEQKDTSYTLSAYLDMERKLGQHNKHSFFAGGSYYMSRQSDISSLDMGIISGKAGFNFNSRIFTLSPQVIYNNISLDGNSYMDTAGTALRSNHFINKKTAAYAEGKYLNQKYKNSNSYKNNSERNSYVTALTLGLRRILTPKMTIEAQGTGSIKNAKTNAYDSNIIEAALKHFWLLGKNTYLMTSFSVSEEKYKNKGEASFTNIFLQAAGKKRKDISPRASLVLGFFLFKDISMNIGYEYYHNDSNIQAYTYTNHKGSCTASWKLPL